jgi:hypothetical protein
MIHFAVAFGMLLHVAFWGAGLAMLVMPRPWRRFWPVLIVPAGLALQSAVVWAGAHAGLRGTNSYAWWSEVIPVALLLLAFRRGSLRSRAGLQIASSPPRERWDDLGSRIDPCSPEQGHQNSDRGINVFRAAWNDLSRFGVVWATTAGCLALLVLPFVFAAKGLTTISLGSCDAADYAAGARVLQEFGHSSRVGFLGLTEVVQVASVTNFFDYWLRLNHFTPSALIAFNGAIFHCAPHEVTSLLTAVVLAGTLPLVFWSSRAILGYSGGVSVIIAGLFGISPIPWYAFGHVSPGQLLAAQAIVLLTWAGVALWNGRLGWQRGAQFAAALAIGYWLILGSYNIFILLCLVPAVAYAGGLAIARRQWRRLGFWFVVTLTPLVGCGIIFFGRLAGLVERFTLLQTYDFGWRIPPLTAEGWLGMVQGPGLHAWDFFGVRWVLSAAVVGVFGWALLRAIRERRRASWLVLAIVLPLLGGYLFLQARGARLETNASYDAYKLFAAFYPLLLPAFCWWVTLRRSRRITEWLFVCAVAGVIVAFNLLSCGMFVWKLCRPPLIVDGELRQLRKIEAMPDVKSVNMLIPDMWSRLWANAFLLRKQQYFLTDTYEARWHSPLRGDWDLEGGLISIELPDGARRQVTRRFALVDTRHAAFVRADFRDGWHPDERDPATGEAWQWSKGEATLRLVNPHDYPLSIHCSFDGWSAIERRLSFVRAGGEPRPILRLETNRSVKNLPVLGVPPGETTLVLRTDEPPFFAPGDPRPLGIAVFRFTIAPSR